MNNIFVKTTVEGFKKVGLIVPTAGGDATQTDASESSESEEDGDVTAELPPDIVEMLVSDSEAEEFDRFS